MKKTITFIFTVTLAPIALFAADPTFQINREGAATNTHGIKFGLNLDNVVYNDTVLKNGMYIGLYRPYAKYSYEEKQSVMVRGKMNLTYLEAAGSSNPPTTIVGSLEIMKAELSFGQHHVRLGRDFVMIGRGVLFSNFADGVSYTFLSKYITAQALGLYSGSYDSCAISVQGCKGSASAFDLQNIPADGTVANAGQRIFAGGQAITKPFAGHQFTLMGLYTKHLIKESATATTRYEVNPYWAGVGSKGPIFVSSIRYSAEFFYMGGSTYNVTDGTQSAKAEFQSFAGAGEITYSPGLFKDYSLKAIGAAAFGTGDEDKANVRNPVQTNTAGKDNSFFHYGAFSGGLALKPTLANIQIYRFGFMVRPLRMFYFTRDVTLTVLGSKYLKMVANGPISDTNATEKNADIGMAADAGISWPFRSDLRFSTAAGVFMPGAAYTGTKKDTQVAWLVNLTLMF